MILEDIFPNEHLFALSTKLPLFTDIANYLDAGKLPQHLSPREKQKVIRDSAKYSWIQGYPFQTSIDQVIR